MIKYNFLFCIIVLIVYVTKWVRPIKYFSKKVL